MNIFALAKSPETAAQMHCDKHVVKMILESAQMICTTAHYFGFYAPYKPTHLNHPCTKWVRESQENFSWLLRLIIALNDEWKYRYNHPHDNHLSYTKVILNVSWGDISLKLPDVPQTPFAQAMPEQYQGPDAIAAYRAYYLGDKADLLQYTKRPKPEWIK